IVFFFFFSSRRRHTRCLSDWSSDVCSSDLLLRMYAHPLHEVRARADAMLAELRQVIPAFLARIDQRDRGGRWIEYLASTRQRVETVAAPLLASAEAAPRDEVTLTDFDPDGEVKVVAAALYSVSDLPDD